MSTSYPPLKLKVDPARETVQYQNPTVGFFTITPALAAQLMEHMLNPRSIRQVALNQRKADLADGNWSMEAGSILFDRYGWLRDGQHRLTAVVATGVTIVANVVLGASETAVQATDTGSKRSWSDQLKGRGVHNAITMQAGVTLSWKWDHDLNGMGMYTSPTVAQLNAWFADHPFCEEHAVEAMRWKRALKAGRPGVFFALIARMNTIDAVAARAWGDAMELGANLDPNDPIKKVRDRTMTSASRPGQVSDRVIELGVMVKAWNLWVLGREVKYLSWRRQDRREAFPQMLDLNGDVYPFPDVVTPTAGRGLAHGSGQIASPNGSGRVKVLVDQMGEAGD